MPDEPYARRLASWRTNPATLDHALAWPRCCARSSGLARTIPRPMTSSAARSWRPGERLRCRRAPFATAAKLAPRRADIRTDEGEALVVGAGGKVTPQAEAAFRTALTLDPKNQAARFYLARAVIDRGDTEAGLAGWRSLLADMTPDDPRRHGADRRYRSTAGPEVAKPPPGSRPPTERPVRRAPAFGPQAAFIRSMVARQSRRAEGPPGRPAGLGAAGAILRRAGAMRPPQRDALAQARRLFARPAGRLSADRGGGGEPAGGRLVSLSAPASTSRVRQRGPKMQPFRSRRSGPMSTIDPW